MPVDGPEKLRQIIGKRDNLKSLGALMLTLPNQFSRAQAGRARRDAGRMAPSPHRGLEAAGLWEMPRRAPSIAQALADSCSERRRVAAQPEERPAPGAAGR